MWKNKTKTKPKHILIDVYKAVFCSCPKKRWIHLESDSRVLLFLVWFRGMSLTVGENRLNGKSPAVQSLSVSRHAENNSAGSETPIRPSSLRTDGLLQRATEDQWHEERLSEGCHFWLTGDRYLPLCSITSSRGPRVGVEAPGERKRTPVTCLSGKLAKIK